MPLLDKFSRGTKFGAKAGLYVGACIGIVIACTTGFTVWLLLSIVTFGIAIPLLPVTMVASFYGGAVVGAGIGAAVFTPPTVLVVGGVCILTWTGIKAKRATIASKKAVEAAVGGAVDKYHAKRTVALQKAQNQVTNSLQTISDQNYFLATSLSNSISSMAREFYIHEALNLQLGSIDEASNTLLALLFDEQNELLKVVTAQQDSNMYGNCAVMFSNGIVAVENATVFLDNLIVCHDLLPKDVQRIVVCCTTEKPKLSGGYFQVLPVAGVYDAKCAKKFAKAHPEKNVQSSLQDSDSSSSLLASATSNFSAIMGNLKIENFTVVSKRSVYVKVSLFVKYSPTATVSAVQTWRSATKKNILAANWTDVVKLECSLDEEKEYQVELVIDIFEKHGKLRSDKCLGSITVDLYSLYNNNREEASACEVTAVHDVNDATGTAVIAKLSMSLTLRASKNVDDEVDRIYSAVEDVKETQEVEAETDLAELIPFFVLEEVGDYNSHLLCYIEKLPNINSKSEKKEATEKVDRDHGTWLYRPVDMPFQSKALDDLVARIVMDCKPTIQFDSITRVSICSASAFKCSLYCFDRLGFETVTEFDSTESHGKHKIHIKPANISANTLELGLACELQNSKEAPQVILVGLADSDTIKHELTGAAVASQLLLHATFRKNPSAFSRKGDKIAVTTMALAINDDIDTVIKKALAPCKPSTLQVTVKSATGLPDDDNIVTVSYGADIYTTQPVKSVNPQWNETFTFPIDKNNWNSTISLQCSNAGTIQYDLEKYKLPFHYELKFEEDIAKSLLFSVVPM